MKKKLLATVMSLTMILAFMPAMAFADTVPDTTANGWDAFVVMEYSDSDVSLTAHARDGSDDFDADSYQWYKYDESTMTHTILSGETDDTLVVSDTGTYDCAVSYNDQVYIAECEVHGWWIGYDYTDKLSYEKNDSTEKYEATLSFEIRYWSKAWDSNGPDLTYEWEKDGEPFTTQATNSLTLSADSLDDVEDFATYYCTVTNEVAEGRYAAERACFEVYKSDVPDGDDDNDEGYNICFNSDGDDGNNVYSDGDKVLTVNTGELDEAGVEYTLEYTLEYDPKVDEDDDTTWSELINTDDVKYCEKYETEGGEKGAILHGAAIWSAVSALEDKEKNELRVSVVAKTGEGKKIASGYLRLSVYEAYADYGFSDSDTESVAGSYFYIYKEQTAKVFSAAFPYGEFVDYEVGSVTVNGVNIGYDNDINAWRFKIASGENEVVVTHQKVDASKGETSDTDIESSNFIITGKDEVYWIDRMESDKDRILPGEEITIISNAGRYTLGDEGEETTDFNGFKYKWEISVNGGAYFDAGSSNDYFNVTIKTAGDNSESKAVVKAKTSIADTVFENFEDGEIPISVRCSIVSDGTGETLKKSENEFKLTNEYYELRLDKELDEYMASGSSITIDPSTYRHYYENHTPKVEKLKNVKYDFEFETNEIEIKSGSTVVRNDLDYHEGGIYDGPFTITRKTRGNAELGIDAVEYSTDGITYWGRGDKGGYISHMFMELYDFLGFEVTGITNRTYNGKAQTQNITVAADGPDGGRCELAKGEDYKLVYRNNVNAGTATVEIVGIKLYNGAKITKTFTIAKAAQSPSVTAKTKTVKVKKVKKKAQTVAPLTVKGAKGTVTYKGVGTNKKSKKALKINKKTGKITVKKGTKKGTYKMKVTVTAAATANYNKKAIKKTVTIKVK